MLHRPQALGAEVAIESLDVADQVLHELAWIGQRLQTIAAAAKAKIDAIKVEADREAVCTIEGQPVSLVDRKAHLEELLSAWVAEHIAGHLPDKKRSIDLPHGKLGLRQQPLVAQVDDDHNAASVLDAIDEFTGLVTAINAILERKTSIGTARARDLIDIKVVPACKAMKDALEARRLTAEDLQKLGIALRDAYDEPVVTPTRNLVLPE